MEKREILNKLILFIRNEAREDELPISSKTLIEDDLGITGFEASDLIKAFANEYKVEIKDFKFNEYFYNELNIFGGSPEKIKPLTVGDLANAIVMGRLDNSTIGLSYQEF